ncbi:MAG: HAD-IIIA family hydrolase [Deltaproteobacteria bacterium]|nr:HAD-IIIA family hydrolase [Deltaproteobacteria bacterium]
MEKASQKIRLIFLDVDGVMTDGRVTIDDRGEETKSFNVKDGLGLKLLMAHNIEVVIVSGRESKAVAHRAGELGIIEVHQGVTDKQVLLRGIIRDKGLEKDEICSMGDDLPDLPMLMEAGTRIAVSDAVKEVREVADFITKSRGGHGAVREACEWILKSQGRWSAVVAAHKGK